MQPEFASPLPSLLLLDFGGYVFVFLCKADEVDVNSPRSSPQTGNWGEVLSILELHNFQVESDKRSIAWVSLGWTWNVYSFSIPGVVHLLAPHLSQKILGFFFFNLGSNFGRLVGSKLGKILALHAVYTSQPVVT